MKGDVPIKVVRVFKLVQYLCEFPPKSIEKLALLVDVSPKTVYKDIPIIESIGYEIVKDENYRYSIKQSDRSAYHLNDNEKKLIVATIKKTGLNSTEIRSIVHKLKAIQMIPEVNSLAIMKQLSMIKILIDCVCKKLPITIKDYKSTTIGSKVRDRNVLPLYFDDARMTVTAYDYDLAETRIFKVSRMFDIEALSDPKNEISAPDLPRHESFV